MKQLRLFLPLSAVAALLNGCATVNKTDDWCLTNRPQRPSLGAFLVMTDREVTEAEQHNEYGAQRCGWRP